MTNPSKTYGTSASRMLEILRLAKGTNQDNNAYHMWCEVFGITVNDSDPLISFVPFYRSVADLMQLSADIKEQTAAHTNARNVDLYMRNYPAVDVCLQRFPYAVQNTMRQQIDAVDQHAEHALELIDDLLRMEMPPQPVISRDTLQNLRDELRDVIRDVQGDDNLDDDTRKIVIDLLEEADDALRRARINGVKGLGEGVDKVRGGFIRHPNVLVRLTNSPTGIAIVGVLTAINTAVTTATSVQNIIEGPAKSPPASTQVDTRITNTTIDSGDTKITINKFFWGIEGTQPPKNTERKAIDPAVAELIRRGQRALPAGSSAAEAPDTDEEASTEPDR